METQTHQNGSAPAIAGTSSTALALRGATQPSPYDPKDLSELRIFAKDMHNSGLTKARKPEQIQLVVITGHELGMPPAASMRMIYVADFGQGDQATISADGMVAVCLSHPEVCEYFRCVERSEKGVTYATKRRGNPEERETFGPEDRDRAKLGKVKEGKDESATNWAKYPVVMMGHRAASILARRVYPDLLGGMYTPDEAAEMAVERRAERDVTPLPATAAGATPVSTTSRPPSQPIDAELVDENETRIVKALETATDSGAMNAAVREALRIWPTERPKAVSAAHAAAKKRLAPPAAAAPAPSTTPAAPPAEKVDEATGEVTGGRQPGEDDA